MHKKLFIILSVGMCLTGCASFGTSYQLDSERNYVFPSKTLRVNVPFDQKVSRDSPSRFGKFEWVDFENAHFADETSDKHTIERDTLIADPQRAQAHYKHLESLSSPAFFKWYAHFIKADNSFNRFTVKTKKIITVNNNKGYEMTGMGYKNNHYYSYYVRGTFIFMPGGVVNVMSVNGVYPKEPADLYYYKVKNNHAHFVSSLKEINAAR